MKNKNKTNEKQWIEIAKLHTRMDNLEKKINRIEKQVFNELPHQIQGIQNKIVYGFLAIIAATLILQVILKLF